MKGKAAHIVPGKLILPRLLFLVSMMAAVTIQIGGAQPARPLLQLWNQIDGTNLILRAGAEQGLYYTCQSSSDLIHWTSRAAVLADSTSLMWTQVVSTQSTVEFLRVKVNQQNTTTVTNYAGWTNAVLLNNGLVEAVIVPPVGRVLQFKFLGTADGPFWENRNLDGQTATPTSWNTEGSFGGDKAWPSPQSDWGWPPPSGFDGRPYQTTATNGAATLASQVDPTYQIRVVRKIELGFDEPVMRIKTIFQRTGATTWTNKQLGTWVITQMQDPVGCYVPLAAPSIFTNGYHQLVSAMPSQFLSTNGLLSFTRDLAAAHKLGFDADSLAWVGTNFSLRIDAPRVAGSTPSAYPDGGCNTEVYTNPGTNAAYVELECLGPFYRLGVGEQAEFSTSYTLFHRTETDANAEARKILGLGAN